jgi:hypothetical protein
MVGVDEVDHPCIRLGGVPAVRLVAPLRAIRPLVDAAREMPERRPIRRPLTLGADKGYDARQFIGKFNEPLTSRRAGAGDLCDNAPKSRIAH